MIALRVSFRRVLLALGIATALLALAAAPRPHRIHPPVCDVAPSPEPIEIRAQTECDAQGVTTIVVRGWLTAKSGDNHFAIQLPGKRHTYGAITDARGYFEVRIPRDDFVQELCELPASSGFTDVQMTLQYRYNFERQ